MNIALKLLIFFVFLFVAAMGQSAADSVNGKREKCTQILLAQRRQTRNTANSDTNNKISNFWEILAKRFESNLAALMANFSREFNENMGNLYRNLSGDIESLNETLQRNHQQLSSSLWNLTTFVIKPPRMTTEVEEVNLREGTIEFAGGANPHLRRKIWVFQSEGGTSFAYPMRFALQENNLGADARLSLWGSEWDNGNQHVWTGSQSDWRKEREDKGNVILVTLLISPASSEQPSFKLKFNTTATFHGVVPSSQLVVSEGRQVVSFPPNNSQDFRPQSLFVAVVAPPSGGPFQMRLKFFDLPGTPPTSCDNQFRVFFLEESSTGLPYKLLPASALRGCGHPGVISEPIGNGNATVAIVRFWGNNGRVGRGFKIEIN